MTSRSSTAAPILAVLAVVLVTLGAYVGGYVWLGSYGSGSDAIVRVYAQDWQVSLFAPAARIESLITGRETYAMTPLRKKPAQSTQWRSPSPWWKFW
jgi:hypothetical protein